jgi:photosystem II stability/assembly factor-like uncharacterized protein
MNHAILGFVVVSLAARTAWASDESIADATLRDVQFVDARHGWAVGDRGAIWRTEDGGLSWQLQPSGTVCSLRGVWFVDEKNGWVAGGQGLPYSPASSGLVLGTSDGGRTWQPLSWQQLPRLYRLQFSSAKSGWAWGETSEFYPAGLFSTETAGQRWNPASGPAVRGWLAGFFPARDAGVLAGVDGTLALAGSRGVRPVAVGSFGSRSMRGVKFSDDGTAWTVGDGGLVLRSATQGASWQLANETMPAEVRAVFDWRGVHALGKSVWVVGRPGSVVMVSDDGGGRWQASPTGQPLPLEAIWFNDRQHGWAVGALGTILATQDGGRSWQPRRRGGERAALLAVHGETGSAPLLAHAQLGTDQGYRTVDLAMVAGRQEWNEFDRVTFEARLTDAVAVAGGAAAECEWRFPRSPIALSLSQVMDDWNRRSDGLALKELERRLVLAIRLWRPEVLITDSPDPAVAADPSSALVSQTLERAFQNAADGRSFPELADHAGLQPWSAKKLYVSARGATTPDARMDGAELSRVTGKPLDDLISVAHSLLFESVRPMDCESGWRLAASRLGAERRENSLMAGIVLEPGGPARRRLPPVLEITQAARRAVQARRNVMAIVDRAVEQPVLARQLNAQVGSMVRDLGADQAGHLLLALARMHFQQGRWSEARELMEKLRADNPYHISSAEAHRWLVQFYASSEARQRDRVAGSVGQVSHGPVLPRTQQADSSAESKPAHSDEPRAAQSARTAARGQSALVGALGGDVLWGQGSLEAAKNLQKVSPLAWSDPAVQFPVAAAHRMLGNEKDAEKFYTTFALGRELGPWADAARGERWIRDRQGTSPKQIIVSRRAAAPPRLDCAFDDPVWKAASLARLENVLRTNAEDWQTQLRVAHDTQFLYIALECYSNSGERAAPVRPRAHDADLAAQDRVHLYFDLDRDYATYYHLAVDGRGCVLADCWGDRTWNPAWYVASDGDEHGYRIEAAVPLAELTDAPPRDGTIWAFNAVRVVPGQRILAWSRPADVQPRPEGFGYLVFSDGPLVPPPRSAVAN